jgi:hypothetical protein
MDMYDYVLQFPQPALVTPPKKPPAPPAAKAPEFPTRAQARAKARKEEQDLRDWWSDLPEEKRQEVRNTKFWVTKPKEKKPAAKKPEPKKPASPAKPAEPKNDKYDSLDSHSYSRPPAKPSWESYQGPQQWAMVEM